MGYLIVGARIDPHDWGEARRRPPPPTDVIVQRVLGHERSRTSRATSFLMHDGGGDRSHTVAALPQIIDGLRAEGFEFVPVSDLAWPDARAGDAAANDQEWIWSRAAIGLIFDIVRTGSAWALPSFLCSGFSLVSGRALIVGLLALIEKAAPGARRSSRISADR